VLAEFMRAFDEIRVRAFEREGLAAACTARSPLPPRSWSLPVACCGAGSGRWPEPTFISSFFEDQRLPSGGRGRPSGRCTRGFSGPFATPAMSPTRRAERRQRGRPTAVRDAVPATEVPGGCSPTHGVDARERGAVQASLAALGVRSRLTPAAPRKGRRRGTERVLRPQAEGPGSVGDFPLLHFVEARDWLRAKAPPGSAVDRA
jgi:hypothetical protein